MPEQKKQEEKMPPWIKADSTNFYLEGILHGSLYKYEPEPNMPDMLIAAVRAQSDPVKRLIYVHFRGPDEAMREVAVSLEQYVGKPIKIKVDKAQAYRTSMSLECESLVEIAGFTTPISVRKFK